MRVTNKTVFDAMQLRLRQLTRNLSDSNLVVTTGKQINRLSDNPSGVSQVMSIRSSINNIVQYDKNMDVGLNWLTGGESALSSASEQITDIKLLATQLVNDSNSETQRSDAVARVDGVLRQMLSIANTEVNDNYIFSGTETGVRPFAFDNDANPREVIYKGDHTAFALKTERSTTMEVGRDGSAIFWEDEITVDSTNNAIVFTEDPGSGGNTVRTLSGIIPDGRYNASDLALAVQNAMTEASAANGYQVVYDVSWNTETETFAIAPDGGSVEDELTFQILLDPTRTASVANVNTGVDADIDIADLLHNTGSGTHAGDVVRFDLMAGADSATVAFTVDADDDITRANFLAALETAVDAMPDADIRIDSSHLDAVDNQVSLTSLSGSAIYAENLMLENNASGTFGGNYTGNGFDYNGGTTTGDVIGFDLTLGGETIAGVSVDMDAIGDSIPGFTDADIADAISRNFNNGIVLNNGESVTLQNTAGNTVTLTRNGNDFDFTTTGGQAFAIQNFSDDDASGLGAAAAIDMTAADGALVDSTGVEGPVTVTVTSPASETIAPQSASLDPQLLDTGGGNALYDVAVTVVNPDALSIATPHPLGESPFRLKWGGGEWIVENDPGYDLPTILTGSADAADLDLNGDGETDIQVRFSSPVARADDFVAFDILSGVAKTSIGADLGLGSIDLTYQTLTSDTPVDPIDFITIDHTNNRIEFQEFDILGNPLGSFRATIPPGPGPDGEYTDMDALAAAIGTAMETASTTVPPVTYDVTYDADTSGFRIYGHGASLGQVNILWDTGPNSDINAADTLGFFNADDQMAVPVSDNAVELFTINNLNNRIDFEEVVGGVTTPLSVTLSNGVYTHPDLLAGEIELQMEAATANAVDYNVAYDPSGRRFTIEDAGATLGELHLLWNSGPNAARSAAATLGYDNTANASGTIGGDLLANGWENGDTININFTAGGATLTYAHTVDTAVDTNTSILEDLQAQLNAAFGGIGDFVVNGNQIDFNLTHAALRINNFTDSGGAGAQLEFTGSNGSTVLPPPGGAITANSGADVTLYAADDDAAAGVASHTADTEAVLITIDSTNNRIDFAEVDLNGNRSGQLTAVIPDGDYSDMNALAQAIETAMEAETTLDPPVDYDVSYDYNNSRFIIRGDSPQMSALHLMWDSGANRGRTAAETLGFDPAADDVMQVPGSDTYVAHITIDNTNNRIDFRETLPGGGDEAVCELCALIPNGEYRTMASLAQAVEDAMNGESANFGHQITYDVSYDPENKTFSIKETGDDLQQLDLLWESGQHASQNAAGVLGFNAADDDSVADIESRGPVQWGIFNTLMDLKVYLENNDVSGIERSMTRLDAHFQHFGSIIADTGIKYNRIEVKKQINTELNLSLTERRSNIEDADIIAAVMELQKNELAYEASLKSSARVMQTSLVDFL